MCGIIGQINFNNRPIDPALFDDMRDTMVHRGPDGFGTELRLDGRLALGHRRLSILDLSEQGRQPMSDEEGKIWVTFNGELYNFRSLRQQLIEAGHRFRSTSDTEVLVHGYQEWGLRNLLHRLKGMFAFGLWDEARRKLYIVRDRFGIKPVVYHHGPDRFVFASELKACTRDPAVKKTIRQEALADYFIYSYVPHPQTIYEEFHKLRPAHYLEIDADSGRLEQFRYWTPERKKLRKVGYEEAKAESQRLLQQSVQEHLVSDVPVGLFLSGGFDSTSVLLNMRQTGMEVDAFSLGFAGSERSEHGPAAEIAEKLGARHHVRLLEYKDDVFPLMERLAGHYDEPFAVSSQLTYHHVAELAAKTHKVVLAGDGGDEVFAGYTWYNMLRRWRPGPRSLLRAIRGRGSFQHQQMELYARQQTGVYFYLKRRDIMSPDLIRRMDERKFSYFEGHYHPNGDRVKATQVLDLDTFMLDNCLQRADMSSMLHSLEVRVPFLDHELFEYVYSLPTELYFDPQRNKKMLYDKLADHLPGSILDRRKQGFGFQHRDTLTGPAYEDFLNNGELRKLGILAKPVDFNQINGEIAFHLLFLEQWFRLN